ncbi:hypothetical protein D0T60_17890 [Bacteroides sp. 224]|nr:hypothetical protein [Bacteroides sp. 224]
MVIRVHSRFSSLWVLEEQSNYRSMAPLLLEDGSKPPRPLDSYSGYIANTDVVDRAVLSKIPTSLLAHYDAEGIDCFTLDCIVTPNGSVLEVFFIFSPPCPNITDEEMIYWRSLSDEIKRVAKFTIPEYARGLQFYEIGKRIVISKLLNPEQTKPATRTSGNRLRKPAVQMTEEEREKKRVRDEERKKVHEKYKGKNILELIEVK